MAGTTTPGGVAGAGILPAIDYSKTSDDDILDDAFQPAAAAGDGEGGDDSLEALEGADEGAGDEGQGDEPAGEDELEGDEPAGDEGTDDEEDEEEEQEGEGEGEAEGEESLQALESEFQDTPVPAKLKAFMDQKGGRAVKDLFYRYTAYKDVFPSIQEARTLREKFPTVQDADHAIENTETLARLDGLYFSDDPGKQAEFIKELHNQDGAAFGRFAQQFPEVQFQLDPKGYRADTTDRVTGIFQNLLRAATDLGLGEGKPGQNLKNALDVISMRLFNKPADQLTQRQLRGRQDDPREAGYAERERKIREGEERIANERLVEFRDATNDSAVTKAVGHLEALVKAAAKGTAFEKNTRAIQKMTGEAYSAIDAILKADKNLKSQLTRILRDPQGKRDQAHKDRAINLVMMRFKTLGRKEVSKVISNWTELLHGKSQQRIKNQREQGSRPNITGRSAAGVAGKAGSAKGITSEVIDYSKTSDDDILNDRPTLRKKA